MTDPDPWAPWASVDPAALDAVFALPDFEAQCRALLELAPHVSARQLSLLPWDERHEPREFKTLCETWRAARKNDRAVAPSRDELPLTEAVWAKLEDSARAGLWDEAKKAFDVLGKLATESRPGVKADDAADDYSRLTDHEVLVLSAIVHKLRAEPITTDEAQLLEFVALLGNGDGSVKPVG
jgi:hypothetical protein